MSNVNPEIRKGMDLGGKQPNVALPSYDEESIPLFPDGRPKGLPNFVESKLESTQPLAEGSQAQNTSSISTLMHLLKGNIGTGILAMPNAISNAGLMVGSIGIPVLGLFCVHCMHMLVNCSKTLAAKLNCTSLDYPTTAKQAFALGPAPIQKFASVASCAVNTMLMFTQFGFCCVYFLFVSKSLFEVVTRLNGSSPIDSTGYMAIVLPFMIAINLIRHLKSLDPVSITANVLQSVGLVIVLCNVLPGPYSGNLNVYTAPIRKLPLYFGTAMYAFEGIGVVLPIENNMKTPEDFRGLNGVLNTGMVIVASLYTGVGFYGYLKYGDDVKSSITFNLQQGALSETVRLMFALAIFLSYPLQFLVPISIIWPFLKNKYDLQRFSRKQQRLMEYALRAILVFFTFALACMIPLLHLFIALVGASASSSLALIFPPIIELATIWNSNISRKKLTVIAIKDVFLITFGLFGSIIGTYTTINEIAFCFKHRTDPSCEV